MDRPEYHEIIRDEAGFATEECLDEIGKNLPVVLIKDCSQMEYVRDADDYLGFRGEIDRDNSYFGWFKAPNI